MSDTHDPLCPTDQNLPSIEHPCWFCEFVARVRADERERLWEQIEPLVAVHAEGGMAIPVLPYWEVRKIITGREKWDRDEDN